MNEQILRAWTRLPSGRRLDLANPAPSCWLDSDLAIRLSRTCRWGGESAWPFPLSVAQHSLMVLAVRRQWADHPLTPTEQLMELLHDAEEGFLGFDCISPLKAMLGAPFRDVGNRITQAIFDRYRLPPWSPQSHSLHKKADLTVAASEAVHCIGWTITEVRTVLAMRHAILDTDPLGQAYGGTPWEPWPPAVAARRFLDELVRLCALAERDEGWSTWRGSAPPGQRCRQATATLVHSDGVFNASSGNELAATGCRD